MPKWLNWLLWIVGFGVLPYGLALLLGWSQTGNTPTPDDLFGAGQLLLTALALSGVAASELLGRDGHNLIVLRAIVMTLAILALIGIAAEYGSNTALVSAANNGVAGAVPSSHESLILVSVWAYGFSLVLSGLAVLMPTRPRTGTSMEVKP